MPFWKKIFHKCNKLNKSVQRVKLLDIPEEIVRYIARYLMIEDVLHLSMSCKLLYHMLPKYSFEYKKLDLSSIGSGWSGIKLFHCDSPPITSHIFMATISGRIMVDNNIKPEGNIFIQLIRPQYALKESIVIARHHILLTDPRWIVYECLRSEYTVETVKFLTIEDPIINMIQPGDYLRFTKDVGVIDFSVHTRGVCNKSKITAQKGDSNALMADSSVRLHSKKESFANVIEMFKKQDDKAMRKKSVLKPYGSTRHNVHDILIEGMRRYEGNEDGDILANPNDFWDFHPQLI